MNSCWLVFPLWLAAVLPGQVGASAPVGKAKPKPPVAAERVQNVAFDQHGWPIGADEGRTPAPVGETKKQPTDPAGNKAAGRQDAVARATDDGSAVPPLASGMQLGSPLLDVYQAIQAPGAFKQLGGVVVWWRVTIYGAQGEQIGVRELTHTADTAFAERDRIEYADGRVFGRVGAQVFAERQGMPFPTLHEQAQQELMLFGLHLRLPWGFGDSNAFVVVGKDIEERNGERLRKALLERRPPAGLDVLGPDLDEKPRDRYELLYEPATGLPRELVHRFASSLQTRRVLLEDWREVEGVRMPHRRIYLDDSLRSTTSIELLRIEKQRVSERDFRLH